MTTILRTAILLTLTLLLGCNTTGSGGFHLPRPDLIARAATITPDTAVVEILSRNPTNAPLWLRRLDITLSANGADLAAGIWEGDRLIDAGTSILLDISLPRIEGVTLPADTPASTQGILLVNTRYARSGVLGLLGGESFTYKLPILINPATQP